MGGIRYFLFFDQARESSGGEGVPWNEPQELKSHGRMRYRFFSNSSWMIPRDKCLKDFSSFSDNIEESRRGVGALLPDNQSIPEATV